MKKFLAITAKGKNNEDAEDYDAYLYWLSGFEFAKQKLIDGEPGIYHNLDQETVKNLGEDEIEEEKIIIEPIDPSQVGFGFETIESEAIKDLEIKLKKAIADIEFLKTKITGS